MFAKKTQQECNEKTSEKNDVPWEKVLRQWLERHMAIECLVDPQIDPQVTHVRCGQSVVGRRHCQRRHRPWEGYCVDHRSRRNVPNLDGGVEGGGHDPSAVWAEAEVGDLVTVARLEPPDGAARYRVDDEDGEVGRGDGQEAVVAVQAHPADAFVQLLRLANQLVRRKPPVFQAASSIACYHHL